MKIAVVGAHADGGAHLVLDLVADGAPYKVIDSGRQPGALGHERVRDSGVGFIGRCCPRGRLGS